MIGLLLAMYPATWQRRYGEEFRAVLESRPLGPFDVADVLLGALDARLAPRRYGISAGLTGGHQMMLRIGGVGAVTGGILFFLGIAAASELGGSDEPWIVVGLLGTLGILVALIGLSAFQAYRDPKLAWAAFAIPGIGTLVTIVGMTGMVAMGESEDPFIGSWGAWWIWAVGLLTTLVGSILFGIATLRAAVLSRRAAQALAWSAGVGIIVAFSGFDSGSSTLGGLVIGGFLAAFSLSWVALGVSALRRGPIVAIGAARGASGA
jgi:hypothetical protein